MVAGTAQLSGSGSIWHPLWHKHSTAPTVASLSVMVGVRQMDAGVIDAPLGSQGPNLASAAPTPHAPSKGES